MTSITDIAVKKSTAVIVLVICLAIAGIVSYYSMPRESAPDISIPYVFVSTAYPGVAPLDIEQSITIPIEKKLKGLEGIKNITSSSVEGVSSIVIEFVTGTDIDQVVTKTKDKVDMAKGELPSDLEDDPVVSEINISEMPILVLSLSGNVGLVRIKDLADDLADEIEAVPGVLDAEITGGLEREIRVEPDPLKLAYYGLSLVSLQAVIADENRNTSGGGIRMGDGRFQLRVPGEFRTPDEIFGLVVGTYEGYPVYLKDVAKVIDGYKEETGRSRLNGKPAVNIQVKKRTGENIIRIADRVDEIIAKQSRLWPKGTEVTKLMNEAKDIRMLVEDLENNIITGLIFVIFVLFFAMGIRNAILVSTAIPLSMFISFVILDIMGITLNMVVLFSLTLSLGMLVDNAIVIVENIFRYMEQGVPKLQAAVKATEEVAMPVAASTATTVAAFFPLAFWPGIMGGFMNYLPKTVIVTLISSLFVALVINPVLASIFMKTPQNSNSVKKSAEEVEKAGEAPIEVKGPILRAYKRLLEGSLDNRTPVLLISFLIVCLLVMLWVYRVGLEKSVEFFPSIEPENVYINIKMPEGADLDYADRVARDIELAICRGADYLPSPGEEPTDCYNKIDNTRKRTLRSGVEVMGITDLPDIQYINSRAVSVQGGASLFEENSPNRIGVQLYELKERTRSSYENIEQIRERIRNVTGGEITFSEEEQGPPTGSAINIEISGENSDILGGYAREIRNILEKMPYVYDVRDDYVSGSPTIKVNVDRQKAAILGLSTNTIGFVLKVAYNGMKVSTFRENNEDYDITIQLGDDARKKTDILRELLIPTTQGLIPLSTIAKFEVTGGLGQINRKNDERIVTVKANVDEDKIPGAVVRREAEKYLEKFDLPPGYNIKFTGEEDMQKEAEEFLTKAFAVAIFLVVIILVAMFNSLMQVTIIMISVVLSLGGVFFGLTIMDYPFGIIMTGVGVISLVGVVVNNAIVLIDYTNRLCKKGMGIRDAIIAAGCTRLRPVLLTAVTTILGLIPMVTGVSYDFHRMEIAWMSESSQWWTSMAIAVIFGLAIATVLTLVVVPVLYSTVYSSTLAWERFIKRIRKAYWAPFYRLTGTKPDDQSLEI